MLINPTVNESNQALSLRQYMPCDLTLFYHMGPGYKKQVFPTQTSTSSSTYRSHRWFEAGGKRTSS